jgi:hypothetical protein
MLSVNQPYQLLNTRTSLYETWHLSPSYGVLHKSLPSVCVYVYSLIVTRQRLGCVSLLSVLASVNTFPRQRIHPTTTPLQAQKLRPCTRILLGKVSLTGNQALRHEDVWGSGCIDPRFLDLGVTWR